MAISDKLNYLIETKSQLKDMINYGLPTENQITNETTFRNYVKSIFEAFIESLRDSTTLYTNLPKISGNGTQITLNDTANAPMRITLNPSALSQDATPTPDSPQDIHTISGDNNIVVCGENLFDKNNVTENFRLSSTGASYADNDYDRSDFVQIKSNTSYTCSALTDAECVCEYDNDQTFIKRIMGNSTTNIITTANTKYIRIAVLKTNLNTFKIYETNLENTQTISLGNIEYCKIGDYEDEFILTSGENLFDKSSVTENRYINNTGTLVTDNNFYASDYIDVSNYSSIVFNGNTIVEANWGAKGAFYDTNKTFVSYVDIAKTANVYSIPNNAKYYRTSIRKENIDSIMINKGTTALPYEPYGTNQWYLKKNIGKVVLDGDWNWGTQGTTNYQVTLTGTNKLGLATSGTGISNYFSVASSGTGIYLFPILQSGTDYIRISNAINQWSTLADFKTWLSNNNVEFYYPTSTPTYTQITGTLETQLNNIYKNMLSYKGTTNVSQINNDLPFEMVVSALKDLE